MGGREGLQDDHMPRKAEEVRMEVTETCAHPGHKSTQGYSSELGSRKRLLNLKAFINQAFSRALHVQMISRTFLFKNNSG